ELSHACGYEHPCQLTMTDIDIAIGDHNKTFTLEDSYGYDKQKVEFNGMESLLKDGYLGGGKVY
ncbi:MAG: FMN-binding glutamate synthase family protein, partial [Bacteroidota bacterium]